MRERPYEYVRERSDTERGRRGSRALLLAWALGPTVGRSLGWAYKVAPRRRVTRERKTRDREKDERERERGSGERRERDERETREDEKDGHETRESSTVYAHGALEPLGRREVGEERM